MTIERIILIIIGCTALLWFLLSFIYKLLARRVGDCAIQWVDGYLKLEEYTFPAEDEVRFRFALPMKSTGKQQCLVIDLIGRIHPEGDKYLSLENDVYVYGGNAKRADRYWESVIIKPEDTLIVRGEVTFKTPGRPIKKALAQLEYFNVDLYYKYYCRNLMKYERKIISIRTSDLPEIKDICEYEDRYVTIDEGWRVLPIRTPLLLPGMTFGAVFEKYVKPHVKEGDIVAICESALAIMEGRCYYVEDIKPGFLATHLNKLFKMDSSLSSAYSLEMAIREVGAFRIITAVIIGALGRLIGRAGDFYAYAGRAVATIDDCTGTLPPFDKYVVMGPKNPQKSAEIFKKNTGIDAAVVDVNDLGKVDVLGISDPALKTRVIEALKTNPQGNANEQMPIALIRS